MACDSERKFYGDANLEDQITSSSNALKMTLKSVLHLLTLAPLCVLAFFWSSTSIAADIPSPATSPAAKFSVVAFYNGTFDLAHINFVHEANARFPKMGDQYGFTYTATRNWGHLNKDFLANCQVVMFLDDSPHDPAQRAAFQHYMENGGGWMWSAPRNWYQVI